MRVLFISNLYPPYELGGMEQLCKEAVDGLRECGHTCEVLTSRFGIEEQPTPERALSRALHLQAAVDYYRPLDFFLRRSIHARANRRTLRLTIDTFEPDIVFIWGMWNLSPRVAYWAEQYVPGRVAYAIAGYWPMEPNVHESYWERLSLRRTKLALMAPVRWLALRTLERQRGSHTLEFRYVACVSEYVRQKLDQAGALPHGARVIYNGIDPQPFLEAAAAQTEDGDELRIVYAGELSDHKGVHTAVDALGRLQQAGQLQGLHLTIVGGGHPDYEASLVQRVKEHGLSKWVSFRGRVPRDEIAANLAQHHIFLFTTIGEEPIARSVMEAMAAGLAVIGTPVGGQGEMLEDGTNALVFEPGDSVGLAERISRLRDDPGLRARLASAGRDTVLSRFTLERMVNEMEAWLEEIAA